LKSKKTNSFLFIILFLFGLTFFSSASFSSNDGSKLKAITAEQVVEAPNLNNNQILVSFLPLTQGEATLIQLPQENFYLVDTGSNVTAHELVNLLYEHGVTRLNGIILTNSCVEHSGGLSQVLKQFSVDTIYVPKLIANTFSIPMNKQAIVKQLAKDDILTLMQNVKIEILAPSEPLLLSPQVNSLVFRLVHKDTHFLFTSDINQEIENKLISRYQIQSEILKVSDFGSNMGSSPSFLEKVDPQVGIIFSSDERLYRASEDVLERLNEIWMDTFLLKKQGEIQILSDGTNYEVVEKSEIEE